MESTITLESDSMSFTWMPLSEHSLNPSLRALVSAIMIPPPALSPIAADPSMLSFPTNPVDSEYSTPHSPSHQIPPLPSSLLAPCHLIWGNQPERSARKGDKALRMGEDTGTDRVRTYISCEMASKK
ncbi:hypothetical protein Tco_0820661 [Tanacetum coccineum]|uniref:Uncharacterized protein n=1 Tax=Tanacetum coccineum TaxID=301880 RepID=A0ABQ5ACP3_9ASTR